jgi:hypothetical protein
VKTLTTRTKEVFLTDDVDNGKANLCERIPIGPWRLRRSQGSLREAPSVSNAIARLTLASSHIQRLHAHKSSVARAEDWRLRRLVNAALCVRTK